MATLIAVFYDQDNNEVGRGPVTIAPGDPPRLIMPAGAVSLQLELPPLGV